jgi:hypothetical protein
MSIIGPTQLEAPKREQFWLNYGKLYMTTSCGLLRGEASNTEKWVGIIYSKHRNPISLASMQDKMPLNHSE